MCSCPCRRWSSVSEQHTEANLQSYQPKRRRTVLLLPRNVTLQQFKSPLHTDDITIKEFEESQNYGSGNLRSDYKSTFYGVRDESHSTKFQGDYSRKRISLLKDRLLRAKSSVIGPFKQPLSPRVEAKKFDASLVKGLTSEATVRFISTVIHSYSQTHSQTHSNRIQWTKLHLTTTPTTT